MVNYVKWKVNYSLLESHYQINNKLSGASSTWKDWMILGLLWCMIIGWVCLWTVTSVGDTWTCTGASFASTSTEGVTAFTSIGSAYALMFIGSNWTEFITVGGSKEPVLVPVLKLFGLFGMRGVIIKFIRSSYWPSLSVLSLESSSAGPSY